MMTRTPETGQNGRSWGISLSLLPWLVRVSIISELHRVLTISVLSPLASSMFAPGIKQIAEALNTTSQAVIACQTGFVIMLGIGPLVYLSTLNHEYYTHATIF